MRIGFFTDYYWPTRTGVSTAVESFRKQLEVLGHEVYIFAPADGMRINEDDDHIIRFPAIKGLFVENYMTSVFFPAQQIRKIEKLDLEIVHVHTPSQIGLLGVHVALKNDIPLVTTYHTDLNEYIKTYPVIGTGFMVLSLLAPLITGGGFKDAKLIRPSRDRERMNQEATQQAMTLIHNYCDLVIAPSKKMELQLEEWQTTAPIEILPTGVDKITTSLEEIRQKKNKYDITPEDVVVMYTGRLGKEKNIELLVRSFAEALKTLPRIKLMLVGDFKHSQELVDLADNLGITPQLIRTGYVDHDEMGAILACADLYAFPSLTETQSLTVNEAAQAGLPLLLVDPLINDVVQDGVNGLIVKPTVADFTAGIIKILSDKALMAKMGTASITLAKKFSEAAQAKKLADLYQAILDKRQI